MLKSQMKLYIRQQYIVLWPNGKHSEEPYAFIRLREPYPVYIRVCIPQNIPYTAKYPYTPPEAVFTIYTRTYTVNTPQNTVYVSSYLVAGMLLGGSSFVLPEVMGGARRIIR